MSEAGSAEIRDQSRIVDALSRIVKAIQDVEDLQVLLKAIMGESKSLLGCEASSLFLYDEAKNDLYFEVVVGGDEGIRAIRVPLGEGIVGAAATKNETQIVKDTASDERHFKIDSSGFVTRNLIATPMVRDGKLIGVLEVLNKSEGTFDELDAKILEIMAEHAGAAIVKARLIQANIQAQRLAALGTASASLAHYLKNVLTQWRGSASLIDMGLENDSPEIVAEAWPILKRGTDKMGKLVQDMLAISRERKPEREEVHLNELLEQISAESAATAEKQGIALVTQLDPRVPIAQFDPTRMHDTLLNLVGNAMDAIEEHGIEGGQVTLSTVFDPEEVMITVKVEDNGPGMPDEVQKRIFEPFFSTKGSKGTGLGLAVVKKTIEEHGGTLELISEVGVGTTFTVVLPAGVDAD